MWLLVVMLIGPNTAFALPMKDKAACEAQRGPMIEAAEKDSPTAYIVECVRAPSQPQGKPLDRLHGHKVRRGLRHDGRAV
jgi:hypothetical protein